jgi:hypothetical protein
MQASIVVPRRADGKREMAMDAIGIGDIGRFAFSLGYLLGCDR